MAQRAASVAVTASATHPLAEVNERYWSQWASGTEVSSGWLGSLLGCLLGTNLSASNAAALRGINYVRWLTGLSPVTLDAKLNRLSLAAALIMQANQQLTHHPGKGLTCWSKAGADGASHANLAWEEPDITPLDAIKMYLDDPGGPNYGVGHRRWLLYPPTTRMGFGSTRQFNAVYVLGPTSSTQASPTYVRWPAAGSFPGTLASTRWSIGGNGLKLGSASVSVYRDGKRLGTTRERLEGRVGQPTLVWRMPSGYARTGTYRVVVKGLHRTGKRAAFGTSYDVHLFTPQR